MKKYRICFDLDGVLCENKKEGEYYSKLLPIEGMPEYLTQLKNDGHYIIINTARNMVTYNNNVGQIIANQAPIVIEWLKKHNIPYDELLFGKPHADFFIDDKAIKFITTEQLKTSLNIL